MDRSAQLTDKIVSPPHCKGCGVEKVQSANQSRFLVLTSFIPPFSRSRHKPQNVLLLLQDTQTGRHSFRSLAVCQEEQKSGSVDFQDVTWGKSIHPSADHAFLDIHSYEVKLKATDYVIKDVVSRRVGKRTLITVIFDVVGKHRKILLTRLRLIFNYLHEGSARCSLTKFIKAGGDRQRALHILREREKCTKPIFGTQEIRGVQV